MNHAERLRVIQTSLKTEKATTCQYLLHFNYFLVKDEIPSK